jgi:hypothetical protein
MQTPFAARIDQAVGDQRLEYMQPALELQLIELNLDHIAIQLGCLAVFWKNGDLLRLAFARLRDLDRLTPGGMLLIINLAEIQYLALYHPVPATASIFDDAPVTVFFTVLDALGRTQKHAHSLTNQ